MQTATRFMELDEQTHTLVDEKFKIKQEMAKHKADALFDVFDRDDLTEDERLALKYLYAYMPLNDLADYESDLFLKHVRDVFHIQSIVPWGEKIPADLFLHFVLPYRVNNENIEDVRAILFEEIFPRVKDLSMEDAILETNHWAHEKANYIGNDRRTVSPLTLIRTAIGRCGEQSSLAVAALRSIGIPARQVYTPLWAHSDSNHAWVEAWADGEWHFFGACEPEPRLNQGWFQSPARRAMLIHTRIGANYNGPEDVTLAHPWYSELNLMHLYAKTKELTVRVVDQNDTPVNEANVRFQLFNFGDFRPMLNMKTDERGEVTVNFGLGDVYINAFTDDGWAFAKCDIRETDTITLTLTTDIKTDDVETFAMVPPASVEDGVNEPVSEAEQAAHNERTKAGAAMRATFEATFADDAQAEKTAAAFNLPTERVKAVLKHARGNSHEITAFLQEYAPAYGEWALKLLEVLNEKDLTDTFRPALADYLINAMAKKTPALDEALFASYVLNPRVDFEMLTPHRAFFLEALEASDVAHFKTEPLALAAWLDETFDVITGINYYQGSATPAGSFKLKTGDEASRDILFVALARTIGIPARLNPADKTPQYYTNEAWQNVAFADKASDATAETTEVSVETGTVRWETESDAQTEIEYSANFTISRFTDGTYQTLAFKLTDEEKEQLDLPVGNYRLTTSTRLSNGTALICFRYFTVAANETLTVPVTFPVDTTEVPVLAEAALDFTVEHRDGSSAQAAATTAKTGATFAWIAPDREPTKHLLRELREMKDEWETYDVNMNCFVTEEKWNLVAPLVAAGDLPTNVHFFKETNDFAGMVDIAKNLAKPAQVGAELPVVYVVDADGQIRHASFGYKLGISRDIIDVYNQITE